MDNALARMNIIPYFVDNNFSVIPREYYISVKKNMKDMGILSPHQYHNDVELCYKVQDYHFNIPKTTFKKYIKYLRTNTFLKLTKIQKRVINMPYDPNFLKIVDNFLWLNHNKGVFNRHSKSNVYLNRKMFYFDHYDGTSPMKMEYNLKSITPHTVDLIITLGLKNGKFLFINYLVVNFAMKNQLLYKDIIDAIFKSDDDIITLFKQYIMPMIGNLNYLILAIWYVLKNTKDKDPTYCYKVFQNYDTVGIRININSAISDVLSIGYKLSINGMTQLYFNGFISNANDGKYSPTVTKYILLNTNWRDRGVAKIIYTALSNTSNIYEFSRILDVLQLSLDDKKLLWGSTESKILLDSIISRQSLAITGSIIKLILISISNIIQYNNSSAIIKKFHNILKRIINLTNDILGINRLYYANFTNNPNVSVGSLIINNIMDKWIEKNINSI